MTHDLVNRNDPMMLVTWDFVCSLLRVINVGLSLVWLKTFKSHIALTLHSPKFQSNLTDTHRWIDQWLKEKENGMIEIHHENHPIDHMYGHHHQSFITWGFIGFYHKTVHGLDHVRFSWIFWIWSTWVFIWLLVQWEEEVSNYSSTYNSWNLLK